jgi:erythronate-4-phosphate dehydrogenase
MNVIIDKDIPFIKGVLEKVAVDVKYLSYNEINAEIVSDADALIIRTRTKCNKNLLEKSKVKFIATATIGYDHIDTEYCNRNNIKWTNASGCNALSVTQYMSSVFCYLSKKKNIDLRNKTIGIVGVGNVGTRIAKLAQSFGMKVLLNDPPRARNEGKTDFVSLTEIAEKADIISFHPFLHLDGEDKSYHLADEAFFQLLKKRPIIINASRGEVIKTEALKEAMEKNLVSDVVLDCWENEPAIDTELLKKVTIATPHIAGYSTDGKANATMQSVRAASQFFNLGIDNWEPEELPQGINHNFESENDCDFLLKTYSIEEDMRKLIESPVDFEKLRSTYPVRREPKAYKNKLPEGFEEKFPVFFEE